MLRQVSGDSKTSADALVDEKATLQADRDVFTLYATSGGKWRKQYQENSSKFFKLDTAFSEFDQKTKNYQEKTYIASLSFPDKEPLTILKLTKAADAMHNQFNEFLKQEDQINLAKNITQFADGVESLRKSLDKPGNFEKIDSEYKKLVDNLLKSLKDQFDEAKKLQSQINEYRIQLSRWNEDYPIEKIGEFPLKNSFQLQEELQKTLNNHLQFISEVSMQLIKGKYLPLLYKSQKYEEFSKIWQSEAKQKAQEANQIHQGLKSRQRKFEQIENELKERKIKLSDFPEQKNRADIVNELTTRMQQYSKQISSLNETIRQCEFTFNYLTETMKGDPTFDGNAIYKETIKLLRDSYEEPLKQIEEIQKQLLIYREAIKNSKHSHSDKALQADTELYQKLAKAIADDFQSFSQCYKTLTIECSPKYKEEQRRVWRINDLLKIIYNDIGKLENELDKVGNDFRGVTQFKQQFAALLLYNTIHQSDLDNIMGRYQKWLIDIAKNPNIGVGIDKDFYTTIKKCQENFSQLKEELSAWRISTATYVGGTALSKSSSLLSGALSIVLPTTDILPPSIKDTIRTGHSVLMSGADSAGHSAINLGSSTLMNRAGSFLTPQQRSSSKSLLSSTTTTSEDTKEDSVDLPTSKSQMLLSGKKHISVIEEKSEISLQVETDHLWQTLWYAGILNEFKNKTIILTGIATSISIALTVTGVAAPLANILLVSGLTMGMVSMGVYDEIQERAHDDEIRFAAKERLEKIDESLKSLDLGPIHQNFLHYYQNTHDFIKDQFHHLLLTLNENKDLSKNEKQILNHIKNCLYYLDIIQKKLDDYVVTLPSPTVEEDFILDKEFSPKETKIETPPEKLLDPEVKPSAFAELEKFLQKESERDKDSLLSSTRFLEKSDSTTSIDRIAKEMSKARSRVSTLEELLKSVKIGNTPLQNTVKEAERRLNATHYSSKLFRSKQNEEALKTVKQTELLLAPTGGVIQQPSLQKGKR